ncbi:hypothetical protein ACIBQ5_15865 [Streptomyces massasporeus]|uniref:hypothetical protein n=1 Tax=Streptomyces massasporeus TaxID=67324 RepID=UPI0037A9DF6A
MSRAVTPHRCSRSRSASRKADPALIAGDGRHFAAIAEGLEEAIAELSDLLDEVSTADGLERQAALDDQSEVIADLGGSRSPRVRDVLDAEALEVARRGVTAARELDDDVPVLAAALGRLGDCLAHNGRPAEALRATEEAAALAQPLAEAERARHEPLYAGILAGLAVRLAEAGRHQDALEVGERAATPGASSPPPPPPTSRDWPTPYTLTAASSPTKGFRPSPS